MDFRIIESDKIELIGISRQYDGEGYGAREELRHLMWSYELDDIPGRLCKGTGTSRPHITTAGGTAYEGRQVYDRPRGRGRLNRA